MQNRDGTCRYRVEAISGLLLAAMALALKPSPVQAATTPAPDASNNAIVVLGNSLAPPPAAPAFDTVTITGDRLDNTASDRLEDVLSTIAGFQEFRRSDSTSANPSAQGATLRALGGNAASRSLVLLDGVPLADPMFGSIPFSALVPERLRAVRITRGGGSGAFGAGAVAGTIALESANADALGLFSGEAMANDRGETALSGTLAPHLGAGFAVIGARWDRGEGYWTTPASQRVPASARAAYNSWSVALRGVAPIAPDIELQSRALIFDDQRTLRFAGANSTSNGLDTSLRLVGHGKWQFDILAYGQARGFSNVVISSSTFRRTLDQRSTPSTGFGGKAEVRPPLGAAHVMRLGADWRTARGDLSEVSYNANKSADPQAGQRRAGGRNGDIGLFAEDDWTVLGTGGRHDGAPGQLLLTGGVRADRWTIDSGYITLDTPAGLPTSDIRYGARDGWALSGRGGLIWRPLHGVALRGSAYSSIRQPTLNELYRTYTVFPVTTEANPALGNERLKGYEGGIDLAIARGTSLSVTAFDNRIDHAIANVTVGTNLQLRENIDAIHARGIEADAGWTLDRLSLNGSLAWTDAKVDATGLAIDGLRPAQTPKLSASGTASWRPRWLGRDGWVLSATVHRVGAQFEDDLNSYVLPGATTLGAYAEVPLGRGFSLVLRGQNLTDATVETRNQAGSIDLGTPRTVWFGFKAGI